MKLEQLKAQLQEAVAQAEAANQVLEAMPEFKHLVKCRSAVSKLEGQIKAEIANEQALAEEQIEKEIRAAGFELRTDHKTGSSNHDDGEPWTFIICHSSRPPIYSIYEWSNDLSIRSLDDSEWKEVWLLGNGETEEEAWKDAVDSWQLSDYKALALEGLNG